MKENSFTFFDWAKIILNINHKIKFRYVNELNLIQYIFECIPNILLVKFLNENQTVKPNDIKLLTNKCKGYSVDYYSEVFEKTRMLFKSFVKNDTDQLEEIVMHILSEADLDNKLGDNIKKQVVKKAYELLIDKNISEDIVIAKMLISILFFKANMNEDSTNNEFVLILNKELLIAKQKRRFEVIAKRCEPAKNFVGRENDLRSIENMKNIILYGSKTVGKSDLIKQYIKISRNKFKNIVYIVHGDQINDLNSVVIESLTKDDLLVVDNADKINRDVLNNLACGENKKIFVGALNIKGFSRIEVKTLSAKDLEKVFINICSRKRSCKEIKEIINCVDNNIVLTQLLAQLFSKYKDIKKLSEAVCKNPSKVDNKINISILKDNKKITKTYDQWFSDYYKILEIDDKDKCIIANLKILSRGINKDLFIDLLGETTYRSNIDKLIKANVICITDRLNIRITNGSAFLCKDISPNFESSKILINSLNNICQERYRYYSQYKEIEKIILSMVKYFSGNMEHWYREFVLTSFNYCITKSDEKENLQLLYKALEEVIPQDLSLLIYLAGQITERFPGTDTEIISKLLSCRTEDKLLQSNINSLLGKFTGELRLMKDSLLHIKRNNQMATYDGIKQSVDYALLCMEKGRLFEGKLILDNCLSECNKIESKDKFLMIANIRYMYGRSLVEINKYSNKLSLETLKKEQIYNLNLKMRICEIENDLYLANKDRRSMYKYQLSKINIVMPWVKELSCELVRNIYTNDPMEKYLQYVPDIIDYLTGNKIGVIRKHANTYINIKLQKYRNLATNLKEQQLMMRRLENNGKIILDFERISTEFNIITDK